MNAEPDRRTGPGLAFVAGFVDTCGFVALFGLFTAHVTGNFVVIGATLVEFRPGLLTKLLALPTFVIVVALTYLALGARASAGKPSGRATLIVQASLLTAFMIAGLFAAPIADGDAPLAMATGLIGVAAMAVQNAAARGPFKNVTATTVMTGNTTQLVMDMVDLLRRRRDPVTEARFHKNWPVVLAFGLGAIGGALGIAQAGFACILLPIAVLLALAMLRQDTG